MIDAGARRGKSYAMNLAMAAARAPAVLFCDADDVPAAGWLADDGPGARRRIPSSAAGGARPAQQRLGSGVPRPLRRQRDRAWAYLLSALRRLHERQLPRHDQGDVPRHGPLRRGTFEALEDIDFCIRAGLAGFPLEFVPEAVMHVRFRDTLPALARQNYGYAKGSVRLAKRYCRSTSRGWLRRRIRRNVAAWTRPRCRSISR